MKTNFLSKATIAAILSAARHLLSKQAMQDLIQSHQGDLEERRGNRASA